MKDQAPFTEEERDLFVQVSSLFQKFEKLFEKYNHPSDRAAYVSAIHDLQELIVMRCARRQWPNTLLSFNRDEEL